MMKSIVLTSVFCSGICQAMPVKIQDGTLAKCHNKEDLQRNKLQAYKVKSYQAQQFGDAIEVTLNIQMVQCTQINKNFAFKEKNIFDLFSYRTFKDEEILVKTKSANILFYQDGIYKALSNIEIVDGVDTSKIKAIFNVEDILSKDEMELYNLGVGVEFSTTVDFNLSRRIEVSSAELSDEYTQSYGGFRIKLDVK